MSIQDLIALINHSPQHNFLYHFTDPKNLPSISEHGILSKSEIARRNILVPAPGGNQWSRDADAAKGLSNYVNLCLTRSHPMCHIATNDGRIESPRYLAISPEILRTEGVVVSLDVANKRDVSIISLLDAIDKLDLEVLYSRTDWKDPSINSRLKAAERCEVLIPSCVPVSHISRAY